MKWSFHVQIACFAVFYLCMCGGDSWRLMSFCWWYLISSWDTLLSSFYNFVLHPQLVRCWWIAMYPLTIVPFSLFLRGLANIALVS